MNKYFSLFRGRYYLNPAKTEAIENTDVSFLSDMLMGEAMLFSADLSEKLTAWSGKRARMVLARHLIKVRRF